MVEKLHRLSRVMPKYSDLEADSVKRSRTEGNSRMRGMDVLLQAESAYDAMFKFRKDRERNKRYTMGDQWGDVVVCEDGRRMTEEDYIYSQGSVPLKNNLIRPLVRDVVGILISQSTEPTCSARDRREQQDAELLSTVLQYNMQLNQMTEMYARGFEEYLISGLIAHKKTYQRRMDKLECWTDNVPAYNLLLDPNMKDFRTWDCSFVGEIHDVTFEDLCQQFAESPEDYVNLYDIYQYARDNSKYRHTLEDFGVSKSRYNRDFFMPEDEGLCRVIEVWRKESKPRYFCHDYNNGDDFKIEIEDLEELVVKKNLARQQMAIEQGIPLDEVAYIVPKWGMDSYWYAYWLSPFGDILKECETPYAHKEHPYVFKCYPFIDGEIHSFVADIIDQQRYTNRLITLYDWIMRASAKGVLLIPKECIPKDVSPEQFAQNWMRFNSVVVYTPKPGVPEPKQISSNSTNIGIKELLQLQIKFFEDISGVHGALQGKPGYSGMSAALYNQQTQNATTSILDLLNSYQEFIKAAAYKDVKNIQQFYDQKRNFDVAGREVEYDPAKVRNAEINLSIVPSTTTPAYRAMANDFLMEIWKSGQINLEQLLRNGDFPFADQLLQSIQSQKQQIEQGQMPEGFSPQLQQQLEQSQQGVNMNAVNRLHGAITNAA